MSSNSRYDLLPASYFLGLRHHDFDTYDTNLTLIPNLTRLAEGSIQPTTYFEGLNPQLARRSMVPLEEEYRMFIMSLPGAYVKSADQSQEIVHIRADIASNLNGQPRLPVSTLSHHSLEPIVLREDHHGANI
ncbi:hypothetical protein HOY82DRAFT_601275 [Tuber indicum]|nr:hypothetical protein HOY82DRAFT_601275 [Tuber indicum]